jgi:hypothetical protein
MGLLPALLLALIGIATLFIAPWVGGGFLLLALIAGLVGMGWMAKHSDEVVERDVETPHLPGPGNPRSGVD